MSGGINIHVKNVYNLMLKWAHLHLGKADNEFPRKLAYRLHYKDIKGTCPQTHCVSNV